MISIALLFFENKQITNMKPIKKKKAPSIERNSVSDFVGSNYNNNI